MNLVKRTLVVSCLVAISSIAGAWIDTGHMIVATIAKSQLKPSVLAEAERLLKIDAPEKANDFITAACWADDIRRDRPESAPWHYKDHHFRTDGKPATGKPDAENAITAIDKFSKILGDKTKSDADRAEALRFVIHFVGDIHQPLHATARDTDAEPDGDKGGNTFHIGTASIFEGMSRPPHNLHALWDFGVGLFKGYQRPLSAESKAKIDALAASLETKHPRASFANVEETDPEKWALESFEVSKAVVYQLPEGGTPDAAYIAKGQAACELRLALAGYRLADLLNRTIK